MGHIEHQAIVCTGLGDLLPLTSDPATIETAHARALALFGTAVSPLIPSPINGYLSFLVAPDGSKSGWQDDKDGEALRHAFINWLDEHRYSDGGTSVDWVALNYGANSDWARITAHSQEPSRAWQAMGRKP